MEGGDLLTDTVRPIRHEEGAVTRRAVPGPALYHVTTVPEGDVTAYVGILPGYADHAARYAHVMDAWAQRGIGSVALDLRGHGRAQGVRGFCRRFDEFLDDAAELARLVDDRARGAPVFLMGHSFGGLVAASSALDATRSWRGLLLSAPYFGLAMDVPKAKLLAGRIASRLVPKLSVPSGLFGKDMTHDPVRARAYDDDPLVFAGAKARWFTETELAQKRALARAGELKLPLFVVFGGADPVAKLAAAKRFYDEAGSADKTWDALDGLFHEVLNELSWQDIADRMADWMLARAT